MRGIKTLLVAAGVLLVASAGAASNVAADAAFVTKENGTASIAKSETVDGSAYVAGASVRVSGTVNGDVYCAGSSVTVDGTIEGDVLCAASTVTINGTVKGDIRVAAGNVILGGAIDGNATVFAGDVTADSSLQLAGDLNGGAGNVTIDGTVGRDLALGAGTLTLNGTIGRDVTTGIGTVSFGDEARVNGNFAYTSDKEADIPSGVVAGTTDFTRNEDVNTSAQTSGPLWIIVSVLALAVLAVLGTVVMPRQVHAAGNITWGKFGIATIVGLTFIVVAPFAAVLLFISGIGTIVAYVLMLLWLLVMALSPIPFIYFVGTKLYGSRSTQLLVRTTIGALAVMLALLLPVINVFVFIAMVLAGVGMMFLGVPSLYAGNPYQVEKPAKKKAA